VQVRLVCSERVRLYLLLEGVEMTKIEPVAWMADSGDVKLSDEMAEWHRAHWNIPLYSAESGYLREAIAMAVAEERERCAKVCEEVSDYHCDEMADYYCSACAAAIRKGE
jgi:hypothetical protein